MEKPLIYIPPGTNGSTNNWMPSGSCVWSGDACLQKTIYLSDHYPELKAFFLDTLCVRDGYKMALIEEIYQITAADSIEYISQLFRTLALQLAKGTEGLGDQVIKSFCQRSIFPIRTTTSQSALSLQTVQGNNIWFIADRQHLRQSFEGRFPLLAFTVEDIAKMGGLIRVLELDSRLLSKVATGTFRAEGRLKLDAEYTNLMRQKSSFIAW